MNQGPQTPFSESLHAQKYRGPGEGFREYANRVAGVLAPGDHFKPFRDVLLEQRFLPAGRIQQAIGSTRGTTPYNCLDAGTKFITREHGVIDLATAYRYGEVTLLDGNGDWQRARINEFGIREMHGVRLTSGRISKTVLATADHRWILEDGTETTTADLRQGVTLAYVHAPENDTCGQTDYWEGLEHGIIYGDGSAQRVGRYQIRLCGAKRVLESFLRALSVTHPESAGGDPFVVVESDENLKALPLGKSPAYLRGFMQGWMATDGCVSEQPEVSICMDPSEAAWCRRWAPVAGWHPLGWSQLAEQTNFGDRSKESGNLRFDRATLSSEHFLMAHHRERFRPRTAKWRVAEIGWKVRRGMTYCPRVLSTSSFVLEGGVHTGQCYVSGTIEDSLTDGQGSIMSRAKQAARTMQMGGGIGYDFSTLRPRGAAIKKLGSRSSGPISFMGIFNSICLTIASAGHRRGAQMGVMRIDHPDIEEFIRAKQDSVSLTGFNVSIAVTDEFMEAVRDGRPFDLRWGGEVYDTVDARALWDMVMRSTWDWAEPGVLFIDRINQLNPLYYCEMIAATNPCFTGDTKVWTAERGHVPFRDLVGETLHVLTQNEDGRLCYRPMSNIRVTRRHAQLIRVTFDNGESVRCTPNHEFFLRDGRIKAAKDLAQGDSLCSVYRYRANSKGYMRLSNGTSTPLEHHVPFEDVAGLGSTVHAHHINGVKDDNRPSNLRLMYAGDHMRHHMGGDENPLRRMPDRNPMLLDPDCTRGEKNGRWRKDLCTEAMIEMREAGFSYRDVGKQFGCSPYTARKRILDANHRVVSVEFLDDREDVYCGTVDDGAHRFFVALGDHDGVLVANCGEQPLPPFGACLLGSFNLVKYLRSEIGWVFDHQAFARDIAQVVPAMDRVIDVAKYPLYEQEKEAQSKRRMGLGITGLANTVERIGYPYGSEGFLREMTRILETLRNEAYTASALLADERGAFPAFVPDRYLAGEFAKTLPEDVRELILHHGLRNSHLLSIAPTGTISLTADNVSSGIEPVYAYEADRTIQEFDGPATYHVEDYGVKYLDVRGKTADQVTAEEHVAVLCTAARFVDSAVSKTCNVSPDMPWEDFKGLYMAAWEGGAKGCTTFNPGGKRMGILQAKAEEPAACRITEDGRRECE